MFFAKCQPSCLGLNMLNRIFGRTYDWVYLPSVSIEDLIDHIAAVHSKQWVFSGKFSLIESGLDFALLVNSLAPGRFKMKLKKKVFKWILLNDGRGISSEIVPAQLIVNVHRWWSVNIGSDNCLVPSGNKPLPDLMLTQIYIAIWWH